MSETISNMSAGLGANAASAASAAEGAAKSQMAAAALQGALGAVYPLLGHAQAFGIMAFGLSQTALHHLIMWSPVLTLLGLVAILAKKVYESRNIFWKEASANEWLLVIRDGELVKSGIGLQTWVMPQDQTVKFPSLINQVNFNAEQVTAEMQGVDVKGIIIWSVLRTDDGPFKCFKSFGNDLQSQNPTIANEKLGAMATSIVRDRIANMSLDDILKNRTKLRSGIKEEIQKVLTGWGIWLETVEIQDVRILSAKLFKNLQTEYREKSRQDAERISAGINQKIREEELERDTAMGNAEYLASIDGKKRSQQQGLRRDQQAIQRKSQENVIAAKKREQKIAAMIKENQLDTTAQA